MCGRAALVHEPEAVAEWLGLHEVPDLPRRYNLAPTDAIPVVIRPGKLELVRWGVTTLRNPRAAGFVAKRERLPLYSAMSRCLVVVSGFYEWKRLGHAKQPWYIHRRDAAPLVFAGFFDGTGAAIVTAPTSGCVAEVHDRMPVVLERESFAGYLDAGTRIGPFLESASAASLAMHPVGDGVSAVMVGGLQNDHAGLIEPVPERNVDTSPEGRQLGLF